MIVRMEFEIEPADLEEFEADHGGDLTEWVFAEICQNHGFGFLVGIERIKGNG